MLKSHQCGKLFAMCALASVLVACGSSDSLPTATAPPIDPFVEGTDVPLSATVSGTGATEFVKTVAASSADMAEPLKVGNAVLGTSDTDEPDPSV
jgi:hypothetical protein